MTGNPEYDCEHAEQWLMIAWKDLGAARCLYEHGFYQQAVFCLQQSVEKGTKSYGFFFRVIDLKDAFEIRHNSVEVFEKLLVKAIKVFSLLESVLKQYPQINEVLEESMGQQKMSEQLLIATKHLRSLSHQNKKMKNLSGKRLKNWLISFEKMEIAFQEGYKEIENFSLSDREFNRLKRRIVTMMKQFSADAKGEPLVNIDEFNKGFTKEIYERIMRIAGFRSLIVSYASSLLLELSRIMQPHATSRYPELDFDPQSFYSKDLPLIQQFTALCDVTERALGLTEQCISVSMATNED